MPVKRKVRAKSSTPSPHDKKSRKETGSVSSQTDDEIFEALNMAEDLGKKIEHVLLKLGKLGYTAFFSKAHPDKLFVNGKYIAPGESV